MGDEAVAGSMPVGVVADLCAALAQLVLKDPAAAVRTARKLSEVLSRQHQRELAEDLLEVVGAVLPASSAG